MKNKVVRSIIIFLGVIVVAGFLGRLLNTSSEDSGTVIQETKEEDTEIRETEIVRLTEDSSEVYEINTEGNSMVSEWSYTSDEIISKLNVVEYNFSTVNNILTRGAVRQVIDGIAESVGNTKLRAYGGILDYYDSDTDGIYHFYYTMEDESRVWEVICTYNRLVKIIKSDLTVDDILEKEKEFYSSSGSMEYSNDISAVLTVMPITQYQMLKQEVLSEYPLFGLVGIVDRRVSDETYNEVEIYINTDKGVLKVLYDCTKLRYSIEMDSRSFVDVNDYVRRNSGVM